MKQKSPPVDPLKERVSEGDLLKQPNINTREKRMETVADSYRFRK